VIKSVIQTAPPGTPPEQLKIAYVARENYNRHGFKWFWKGMHTSPWLSFAFVFPLGRLQTTEPRLKGVADLT
jgi:hypothetical protein